MCEDPTNKISTLQHAMQAMEAINDALGSASPSVSGLSVGQSGGPPAAAMLCIWECKKNSGGLVGAGEA